MISKAEFRRRVQENTEYFQRNYKRSLDISRYHFFDTAAGDQAPLSLMDKVHDVVTAVAVGALPLTNKSGADAIMLIDGKFQEVELKFSTISSDKYTVGARGGICISTKKCRISIENTILAKWFINNEEHLKTKNRPSILVVFDKCTNEFIDARMISGKKTVNLLTGNKKSKARMINWAGFEKHGSQVKLTVPSLKYNGLCYNILMKTRDSLLEEKKSGEYIEDKMMYVLDKMREFRNKLKQNH
jgi:hypothetical protein